VWSVWTLRNNEIVFRDDAHADKIWGLAVTGDGSCIVTGSSDATVRIWDDVTVDVIAEQVLLNFLVFCVKKILLIPGIEVNK
jgi:WD40 repeat protein